MPLVLTLLEDREPPSARPPSSPSSRRAPASLWRNSAQLRRNSLRSPPAPARPQAHRHTGDVLVNDLRRRNLRPSLLKPLLERLGLGGGGSPESPTRDGGYGYSDRPDPPKRAATTPHLPVRAASARAGGGVSSHRGGAPPPLDEGEEVEPTVVYSERELSKEMESVGELLRNADE